MSTNVETNVGDGSFSTRLIEACGTSEPARIGRMLEVSYQTAKNYLEGRLPAAEVLITIASTTGVSLNWLLTGRGQKSTDAHSSVSVDNAASNRLEDKWSIRHGDLEVVLRASVDIDVAMEQRTLKLLTEALTEVQAVIAKTNPP